MTTLYKKRNKHQDKRLRQLAKLAKMREAKERKRQRLIAEGWSPEPKFKRASLFEYGIRNAITGETHWRPLVSARQAGKALGLILKFV